MLQNDNYLVFNAEDQHFIKHSIDCLTQFVEFNSGSKYTMQQSCVNGFIFKN